MGALRASYRAIRQATGPLRHAVQRLRSQRGVQRTAPLAPEDRTRKRRRWHVLVDLVNEHCPRENVFVVEIGTASGFTSAHLARYCPHISRIVAVDLQTARAQGLVGHVERIEFIQGYSDASAKYVADESVDLVFIDADHSEEWVRKDLTAWFPKVKQGGIVAGHDYGSHNHPGVKIAVDEFLAEHPQPVRLEANKVWWTIR